MSIFDNRYYYLNKLLLSIIGQWPYQSRLKGNAMFAITLFFTGSLTALEFWGLAAGITNLSIIMENASPLLVNSLIFIKMINYFCNKYKMRDLLDRIEETWKELQAGTENEILRHYGEQSRVLTIKYSLALYAVWILYTVPPLAVSGIYSLLPTNETYKARFLYRLEHVLDMDKYFNLLMLHGFLSVFYIVSVVVAVDSIFVAYVQHACAMFEVIRYNVERVRGSNLVTLRPAVADDEAYRTIIGCIESHKRTLKFSELLESAFATSYLFLLGNVIICLSFSAAELIMVDNQFDEIVRITSASLAQVVHIYFLSLVCQRLLDHSSALHGAMYANLLIGGIDYSCDWYAISLRSRQLLKFMLLRTTKPCLIKAGKVYVMSMEGFSSILQVSVSYFTMLTSLQ